MHDQMGIRDAVVDLLDALDGQDVTGRRTGELVGAVGGTNGDRQGVALGVLHEVGSLVRVGQQLVVGQLAFGTGAVFLAGHAGFQGTQAAQLAFHGHTTGVGDLGDLGGHVTVVVVAGRGLHVGHQGAVHHHRAEAGLDGAQADRRLGAVVLVQHDRDVRILLDGGNDVVTQEGLAGVLAGTGGGLNDHRGVDRGGRFHDRVDLFHVVGVVRRHAIAVLGGMVQQLTKGDQCHGFLLNGIGLT